MSDALQILLDMEPAEAEEKEFEVKRLSRLAGKPVVFRLRGIGYSRAAEIREMSGEQDVQILLAGTVSPNWKDKELLEKYGLPPRQRRSRKCCGPARSGICPARWSGFLDTSPGQLRRLKKTRRRNP